MNPIEIIKALRELFASIADTLAKELEIKTKELELWSTGAAQDLIDDVQAQNKKLKERLEDAEYQDELWEKLIAEKDERIRKLEASQQNKGGE